MTSEAARLRRAVDISPSRCNSPADWRVCLQRHDYAQAKDVLLAPHRSVAQLDPSHPPNRDYEVVGIVPLGAAYIMVNDRRIDTLSKAAGKKWRS